MTLLTVTTVLSAGGVVASKRAFSNNSARPVGSPSLTMALSIGFRIVSFLPSCYSSYGALDFYPGGTLTHWLMPAFTGRTLFVADFCLDERIGDLLSSRTHRCELGESQTR